MCTEECFGDYYRGCQHYVLRYYSGVKTDCGQPNCALSTAHMHQTATNCLCTKTAQDNRRVVNMFQAPCEDCRSAEFARITGRPR